MHKYLQSLKKRVVLHRIAPVASLAIAGMVITISMASGAAPGNGSGLSLLDTINGSRSWAGTETFSANPNPIKVCGNATVGSTNLTWNIGTDVNFEIHRNTANGPLLTAGKGPGELPLTSVQRNNRYFLVSVRYQTVSEWQYVGRKFVKVQVQRPVRSTLGTVTLHFTDEGCNTATPPPPAQLPPPPTQLPPPPTQLPPPPTPANTLTCSPSNQNVIVGQPVTVTTNASGTVDYAFTWSAIGASSAIKNGKSLVATYGSVGTKTISVTDYTNTANCSVVVTAAPVDALACSAAPTTVKVGEAVVFSATGGIYGGPGYIWSNTDDGLGVSHYNNTWRVSYNSAGTKTVTVRTGDITATCTVVITPLPTPPAPENRAPMVQIDTADCDLNVISGWAADVDTLNTAIRVRLMEGTTVLASKVTDIQRNDVNNYLASTYNTGHPVSGAHGFSFDLSTIRGDGKVHQFSMEAEDTTTGANQKVNMGNMASFVCQAMTLYQGTIGLSYTKTTLIDKHDNSIIITDPTGRDDTTVTYKYDTVTVGETLDVCPGPDGKPGRLKDISVSGWASPNGGSVWVKDSVTGQDKFLTTFVGPTPQTVKWTALLGAGQTAVTYTFRVSTYYSGANTVATKTVTVRPITGPCDPGEYKMTLITDGTPYCPRNNQYPRVYVQATTDNVPNQPAITNNDGIVLKFRPYGLADIPQNYVTLPVQNKRPNQTNDPNLFAFESVPYTLNVKGTYDFFLKFRGKTILSVSKEEFIGIPSPFCE